MACSGAEGVFLEIVGSRDGWPRYEVRWVARHPEEPTQAYLQRCLDGGGALGLHRGLYQLAVRE